MKSILPRALAIALLGGAFLPLQPAFAQDQAVPQHVVLQQAGGYTVLVGSLRVTALTDGSVPQDLHALLKHTTDQEIDGLLMQNYQANPVEASINAFLVEMPGRLVLIDTGSGELFGAGNGGRLVESLAAMNVRPDQITDVLITHAHSDHSGGLVKGGARVFTNAVVHVSKQEVDFFFDPTSQARTGYDQAYFDTARTTLKPYLDAGKLATFAADGEILPGFVATLRPGHTPGSAFFTLSNAGEHIVFVGDIIHSEAVQFRRPEVTIAYDEDDAAAAKRREDAFAEFARNGDLIAVPHLPFPGLGRIRADTRGGFDWLPVTYTNRAGR